ncbi:hypothetical protein D3C76_993550 [compost metagenome]
MFLVRIEPAHGGSAGCNRAAGRAGARPGYPGGRRRRTEPRRGARPVAARRAPVVDGRGRGTGHGPLCAAVLRPDPARRASAGYQRGRAVPADPPHPRAKPRLPDPGADRQCAAGAGARLPGGGHAGHPRQAAEARQFAPGIGATAAGGRGPGGRAGHGLGAARYPSQLAR